jgi:hypothetical protein
VGTVKGTKSGQSIIIEGEAIGKPDWSGMDRCRDFNTPLILAETHAEIASDILRYIT